MGIGAKDYIDQLLVKKYANEKVNNHDIAKSAVSPDEMMKVLDDCAQVQIALMNMKHKMASACNSLASKNAYKTVMAHN